MRLRRFAARAALLLLAFTYGCLAQRFDWAPVPLLRSVARAAAGALGQEPVLAAKARAVAETPPEVRALYGPGHSGERDDRQDASLRSRAELEALGYAAAVEEAGELVGVVRHDPALAYQGLNLLISGRGPEAELQDMDGRPLHRWSLSFAAAFPDLPEDPRAVGRLSWRRVELLADGGLLAIFEGQGLIKLDRDSHLVWAWPGHAHHDFEVQPDGTILVLTRELETRPEISDGPVLVDYVAILDGAGQEQRRISVLDALESSSFSGLLAIAPAQQDPLHTNAVTALVGYGVERLPAFRAGNLLLSLPELNAVVVLDPRSERIVWALAGLWVFQHESSVLPNGNLLVFDNRGDAGWSRILEVDPPTQRILWAYEGRLHGFASAGCGALQRLPNGNTLVTETDNGRAFELTPDQRIVWEYFTPYRAGANNELVARLFAVTRIEPAVCEVWLDAVPAPRD